MLYEFVSRNHKHFRWNSRSERHIVWCYLCKLIGNKCKSWGFPKWCQRQCMQSHANIQFYNIWLVLMSQLVLFLYFREMEKRTKHWMMIQIGDLNDHADLQSTLGCASSGTRNLSSVTICLWDKGNLSQETYMICQQPPTLNVSIRRKIRHLGKCQVVVLGWSSCLCPNWPAHVIFQ